MAIVDQKFVYRDGANVSSAPINGFKLADILADLTTGNEGDLAYTKDTDKLYKYTGSAWIEVGPTVAPPTIPPLSVISKTTTYTLTNSDDVIVCTGTFTLTLHASSGATKKKYDIKNMGTGIITLARTGSDLIDGVTSQLLDMQYISYTLVPNGTDWFLI